MQALFKHISKLYSSISLSRYFTTTLLILITIFGFYLRYSNLSPFKIYPDSYQSLLVAQNLEKYNNVVGFLGEDGMIFPQFAMWTRPFYPLLINAFNLATNNSEISAQIIAILTSLITIPTVFFLTKSIFKSNLTALLSSLLLAISYQHTLWSGFIMTESLGVLMMTLTLLFLFLNLKNESKLADPKDFLTGALFALAILTRYEYAVVSLPIIFLIIKEKKSPLISLLNIFTSAIFVIAIVLSKFFPIIEFAKVITNQMQTLLLSSLIVIIGGVVVSKIKFIKFFFLSTFFVAALILATGLRNFVTHDFILGLTFLIGLKALVKEKQYETLVIFTILSIAILGFIYYKINPEMERYWTHLLPFLIIPSAYGATFLLKLLNNLRDAKKIFSYPAVVVLLLFQIFLAFSGLKLKDESWYHPSYEEISARKVSKVINDRENTMLIASFPEPYYYFTHLTTHSLTDSPPYVFIDDEFNSKTVMVIYDIGMRDIFPNFSKFIEKNLKDYEILSYKVFETYHYANRAEKEKYPVTLYKIPLYELKSMIKNST